MKDVTSTEAKQTATQFRLHHWITVVNPTNSRLLLQACDNCGVVKSENTVVRACSMPPGQRLISDSLNAELSLTA